MNVYWLIVQGKTNTVKAGTLTPAMIIDFDSTKDLLTGGNFEGLTIAAAGVVQNLQASVKHTFKSSDVVTTYSNKGTGSSGGFTVQRNTEYAIILVAKEIGTGNTQTEFQRYGLASSFVSDSKAKIFDLKTIALSIAADATGVVKTQYALSEDATTSSKYTIKVFKDADADYTLSSRDDCVSMKVTASRTGQLTLSSNDVNYGLNELTIPQQCGESISMNVYFKPVPNEIIDGDRTFTLTHFIETATGRLAGLEQVTLSSVVTITLTDNEKGKILLTSSSLEFNEGSSLAMKLKLSDAPPSQDKITVTLAKGAQDEGVAISPTTVVFCCLASSTLFSCTTGVVENHCCTCSDGTTTGYLWSYEVPVTYSSTYDGGLAAADKTVSITATAASALTSYNAVTNAITNIKVKDIDEVGARISPSTLTLDEGGTSKTISIVLTSKPDASVTFKLVDSSEGTSSSVLSFSPSTVTFLGSLTSSTDWKTAKEVQVTYPRDYRKQDVTKKINIKEMGTTADSTGYGADANGIVFLRENLVTVTCVDIDTAGFVITPDTGTISEDGGIFAYTVRLSTIPSSDVKITPRLPSVKGNLIVDPASITLTPETARTNAVTFQVKSTTRDYIDIDGTVSYVIKHLTEAVDTNYLKTSLQDTTIPKATVTVTDVDTAGFVFSKLISGTTNLASDTITELNTDTEYVYYLRLTSKPAKAVVFKIEEVCTDTDGDTNNNCGAFSIKLNDVAGGEHTFPALTDHVTTAAALKVTLTVPYTEVKEKLKSSNLKISVLSGGDERYTPLKSHSMTLSIRDSRYTGDITSGDIAVDTTASKTEVLEVSAGSGVSVKIPAGALPETLTDIKINVNALDISGITISESTDANNNIKTIEDTSKFVTKTSIIEYKITKTNSDTAEVVTFADAVELTIPLDSSDCTTSGVYCQCMRADSSNEAASWEILQGLQTTTDVTDGVTTIIASCFTTSFSLYTVAEVVPAVSIDKAVSAVSFSEANSAVILTPVTVTSALTVTGTGTLLSITARILSNYQSREDYLTINCTNVNGVDNWSPTYTTVTGTTKERTCSGGVWLNGARDADLKATFVISTGSLKVSRVTATNYISETEAQNLFQNIQYVNSKQDPSYGSEYVRDVVFSVSEDQDGDFVGDTGYDTTNVVGTDRHTITVVGYNNPPVLTTSTTANIYVERANAKNVAQLLSITDSDSTSISSAEVWIDGVAIEGDILSYSSTLAQDYNIAGTIEDGKLKFSSEATLSSYQQVLRAVTFESTSYNPTVLTRTIKFKVTDVPQAGLVAQSTEVSRTLTISPVNDAPELLGIALNGVAVSRINLNEDSVQVDGYQLRVDDVDSDASDITFEISCVANKGTVVLNSTTGAVAYTPTANLNGLDSFFVIARDNTGQTSVPFQIDININALPDDPVVTSEIKSFNFRVEWDPKEFDFPITHPDANTDEEFDAIISFIRLDGALPVGTLEFTDESVSELGAKQGKSPFKYSISQADYDDRVNNLDGTRKDSFTDSFSYIVIDTNSRSASGTIKIVVKSDADERATPPVVTSGSTNFDGAYVAQENTAYSGVFYALDTQTQIDDLVFNVAPNPTYGSVSITTVPCGELVSTMKDAGTVECPCNQYPEGCGKFVYTPNSLYYGYDSFEVTATDNGNPPLSSAAAKIHIYIEKINNRPTLACAQPLVTSASTALTGTASLYISNFASIHPLCTESIEVGEVPLASLEDIRAQTRAVLTYSGNFPQSLSAANTGTFAKLITLSNSLEIRADAEIPLLFAKNLEDSWSLPMGGEVTRASMSICAALGADATACAANTGCALVSGACVSAFWGSPNHVVEVAIALVAYDMDEEDGFNVKVAGSGDETQKSVGLLSDPVVLAPLNDEGIVDDEVKIFVANADGTRGSELTWVALATEEKSVLGGVIIVQMPSKRRGAVRIKWRATDARGLKRPIAPSSATITLTTRCAPGHRYMDWWWDTNRCFACPKGWFNQLGQFDQQSCKECIPGQIAAITGLTECSQCPTGSFQPSYGSSECLTCYDGQGLEIQTAQGGSSNLEQCVCPIGYWTDTIETSTSELWSKYLESDASESYYTTETSGTTTLFEEGSIHIDILSHSEFADVGNDAIVPQNADNEYVSLVDRNGDDVKCVGHINQTCSALMTKAGLLSDKIGDGVCNAALNVPECGWDCGDCCRQSCLPQTVRSTLTWSATSDCDEGGYSCVDPRFAAAEASVYKSNANAPLCRACGAGSSCSELDQQFPLPAAGWWVDPTDGSRILQCVEPSAVEACPALTSIQDVLNGVCGLTLDNQLYMGEACSACADGKSTPYYDRRNAFRSNGKCKKCPDVPWLPYLFGSLILFVALPLLNLASKMQDGFGAVNIIVGFTQVVSVFRRLELAWPEEMLDLFELMSVVNLNLELFSIDCFVTTWNWSKKYFVVNFGPIVLGAMFGAVTLIVLLHNKVFLPYVYAPIGRCFGIVLEEDLDPTLNNPNIMRLKPGEKKKDLVEGESGKNNDDDVDGDTDADDEDDEDDEGSSRRKGRKKMNLKKRFLAVRPPDQTQVFARAMHSAYLLFLSWSYMQLVNINVEYFSCTDASDGRSSLDADPSIQCYVGLHKQLFPLVIMFMLLYTAGIPLYISILLFTHRRLLRKRDVIDVRTRPLSIAAGQLLEAEQRFGFIFRRYESGYSWWELVYITRKFFLVVTPVFFKNTLDQCLMTMLVLVPGMLGVVRARPYDKSMLDIMEWLASTAAFFILFAGFLFFGFGEDLSQVSMDSLTWITITLLSLTYLTLVTFVVFDIFPHLNLVSFKMRNRIRKVFGYPPLTEMSQREVNMNRSMRKERAGILRRLKGNAALIFNKNTASTFLKECRKLPLDHKYAVSSKDKKQSSTLLEVLKAIEDCTVGFRLASDREISEILGTQVEEFDYSQKLVGTFFEEMRAIFVSWKLDLIRLKQNLRKAEVDKDYMLEIRRRVISDRLKKGSLTPPAIGEGCLDRYNERFLYDQFVLRCNRDLFLEVVILFEYLRLKEAVAGDPFFETLMGRNMLLNTSPLLSFSKEIANGTAIIDENTAKMLARGALYYDQLKFAFRQRIGEGILDLKAATKSPLANLSNLMVV